MLGTLRYGETEFAYTVVGSGACFSPRLAVRFDSQDEGSKSVA
jgi:hypothetical protein